MRGGWLDVRFVYYLVGPWLNVVMAPSRTLRLSPRYGLLFNDLSVIPLGTCCITCGGLLVYITCVDGLLGKCLNYLIVTVLTLMSVFPGTTPPLKVMWVGPMELTNILVQCVLILPKLLMPPRQTAVWYIRLTLALVALRTRPTPPSVRVVRLLVALFVSLLAVGLTFSRLDMNMKLPVPIVRSHVFSVVGVLEAVMVLTPLSTPRLPLLRGVFSRRGWCWHILLLVMINCMTSMTGNVDHAVAHRVKLCPVCTTFGTWLLIDHLPSP